MRFLIIQENGRHEISKHLRECNSLQRALLFHGVLCDVWGLGHDNYGNKPNFNSYDVIINLENYDTGWVPDLSEFNKPLKLVWAIDSHCQGKDYYSNIFNRGKYYKVLEATKYYVDKDRVWFPNCYDSDFITPIPNIEKNILVGFCGNYCNRKPLFDYVKNRVPEFSLDMDVRGFNMIKTINSYKISFNKNIFNDINYRNFETLGCGSCLLTNHDQQYGELGFKENVHYITYNSKEEAIDKINYLKNNQDLIDKISKDGHNFALKKHTFKNRAKSLISYVNKL